MVKNIITKFIKKYKVYIFNIHKYIHKYFVFTAFTCYVLDVVSQFRIPEQSSNVLVKDTSCILIPADASTVALNSTNSWTSSASSSSIVLQGQCSTNEWRCASGPGTYRMEPLAMEAVKLRPFPRRDSIVQENKVTNQRVLLLVFYLNATFHLLHIQLIEISILRLLKINSLRKK